MEARVQKWGHSLALRIPKALADQVGIRDNAPVTLTLRDGQLVIVPLTAPRIRLEHLLARVTAENLHREVDTGPAVGGEVW